MAQITAMSRCSGLNHIHLTVDTSAGVKSLEMTTDDLIAAAPLADEHYQQFRLALLVREARAAGNNNYALIRTYLLNRAFVE